MAVSFVIGRAGSGKTHRCFTSIINALREQPIGPSIFWILPRQATFSAERDLTCNSGIGGFLRARVLSFDQLGHEIMREQGGIGIPEITPVGRQMILGYLLRTNAAALKFFKNSARQPGLAAKLDKTFSEFERCGKNAADLDMLLQEMASGSTANDGGGLIDKVHDLHLIYNAYTRYLGQDRLDPHQRLLHVLKSLKNSTLFHDATVYVDGFREFTEYERRVLARLGKVCRHIEITLPIDPRSAVLRQPDLMPEEMSLFHSVETAYRRLRMVFREEGVAVDDPVTLLTEVHRFTKSGLTAVEKFAFGTAITHVQKSSDGVELLEAPHRTAEVNAAARRIKQHLADGLRLRDIAVLVRDLSDYHDLLKVSFAEHGIRYFVDRRRTTAHHPLLQFIRAVFAIAQQTWPHEWVMTLLKTDLTGISTSDVDALENHVLAHRIRGGQWPADEPWAFHDKTVLIDEESVGLDRPDELSGIDGASPLKSPVQNDVDTHRRILVEAISPFISRTREMITVREIVASLFDVIERLPVRAILTKWMHTADTANDFEQVSEHSQVWSETIDLFDQIVELLGDERISLAGFQEVLEAGLDQFDLGLTPPTVDEVLVGEVDRTRTPQLKAVFVLGLNEGCFPRVPREESVLSDSDRRELHRRNLEVSPATDRRLLDEQLLGYVACTCASESLYLSRSLSGPGGKPLGPSSFWQRIVKMFPTAPPFVLPHEQRDDPSLIATPGQLVTALMRWVRHPIGEPWPALYQWLTARAATNDPAHRSSLRAWRALSYDNTAALSPETAGRLFANPLRAGVAQIETFAACPFKHFAQYGLRLQPRDDALDVSALDLGHAFHHVLEKVVSHLLKQRKSWADLSDAHKNKLVGTAVEHIGRTLRGEILLSNARNRYLLQRIEKTLGQVIATQKTSAGRGRFSPAFSNLRFGEGESLGEFSLPTPRHRELRLSGKIDRVDLNDVGDGFSVIDYRLGNRKLALDEVYHGLALQLLTYLLVLETNGEALTGRRLTPAAAFYVRMLRWLGDVDHPSEALSPEDPAFHLAAKPRGLLDEQFVNSLDIALEFGESEVIHARINKDGNFGDKGRTDLATADELTALLVTVRGHLGALADGILDGEIGITPYMLGQKTPCPHCEYKGVCRFESRTGYHQLTVLSREEVLLRVMEQQGEKS